MTDIIGGKSPAGNSLKHPLGWKCETCLCWAREVKQDVYVQPGGQAIPVHAALKMGLKTEGMLKCSVAPCTLNPSWTHTNNESFCWQHRSNYVGEF